MKITMSLSEVPSSYTWLPDGLALLTSKSANMGLYSSKVKNLKITCRSTGEVYKFPNLVKPISLETITNLDYVVSQDSADKTLVGVLYQYKMKLKATKGKNKDRYIVTYEV